MKEGRKEGRKERTQKLEIRTSHKSKKETLLKMLSESLPPQPPKTKTKTEDKRLDKAFELSTACSNQALDDCQHFGDVIAVKLRNYNDTLRYAIQNIMRIFVNANSGSYDHHHRTLLQPFNPPQAHFLVCQSISAPPHTSPSSLCPKPLSFMFWKHFTITIQWNDVLTTVNEDILVEALSSRGAHCKIKPAAVLD
jgi:hypothetical protein